MNKASQACEERRSVITDNFSEAYGARNRQCV